MLSCLFILFKLIEILRLILIRNLEVDSASKFLVSYDFFVSYDWFYNDYEFALFFQLFFSVALLKSISAFQ